MTIYDIAKQAGVSASTVSRAINGKAGVSEKKRQEILDLMKKCNYAPDENARNLVKQRSHTVGILTDDLNSKHQNEGTAKIQNELLKNGFYCFIEYIGDGPNAVENGIKDLASRRVEGALLLGISFHDHQVVEKAIRKYLIDIPVMLVHQTKRIPLDNVYSVGADEEKGIRSCVDLLIRRERKNLVLLIDQGRMSEGLIQTSFETEAEKYPDVKCWTYTGVEASRIGGEIAMDRIYDEHPEIDGIICASDSIAIGAMYALQDRGKKIPEEISVIGEDNSELCDVCRPRLTSMDTMISVTTVMAAYILVDVLKGNNRNRSIVLEMEIVDRETL